MPSQEIRFEPRGAIVQALECRANEVIVDGPAGTGKSYGLLWKLNLVAAKYPKARILILRKWRSALAQAALVTWRNGVQPERFGAVEKKAAGMWVYPNDAVVVIGGLDKSTKVMSTEWDIVYVQEATELEEREWEDITTRLRNGAVPYQQVIGDCNPHAATHWIKQRWEADRLVRFKSEHTDNPMLWDDVAQDWTVRGRAYIERLQALRGVRLQRLYKGLWVSAEGMVYEDSWNERLHVIPRFPIPKTWPRYWSVDFGFTNPFVWQAWAQDPDGRLYRYREIYLTGRLVEDHARRILELTRGEPAPKAVICDHDAEGRATLERYLKRETTAAFKGIAEGIQGVAQRLRCAGDGRPRLFLLGGAVGEIDPQLTDAHQPFCTEGEMESYIWDIREGKKPGEEPVDRDNHGNDCMRYLVAHVDKIGKRRRVLRGAVAGQRPVLAAYGTEVRG